MVDYEPFLLRAVAALNPNTSERRRNLYDRARRTLIDKLRASDPTLSGTDLSVERAGLEAAIRRVEADMVRRAATPRANPPYEIYATPVEEYQDKGPLKDRRTPVRFVAGAFGALIIVATGAAAYFFWPRILTSTRTILGSGVVSRIAGSSATNTSYVYLRQPVYYRTNHPVGTIIVDKSQSFLYVVRPNLSALRYGIGVGPECATSAGLYQITRKEERPGQKPPQRSADLSHDQMTSSLGARALHLTKDYRIHGTSVMAAIGHRLSDGCIQLVTSDFIHLYDRTPLESRVVVLN
jgi:hypothetical protein